MKRKAIKEKRFIEEANKSFDRIYAVVEDLLAEYNELPDTSDSEADHLVKLAEIIKEVLN